jgi:transposase-like protein
MADKRQRKPAGQDSVRAGGNEKRTKQRVETLRRGFASFHRSHSPGTRIPQALRNAALLALQNGTSETEVRRACGITSTQLKYWQQTQGPDSQKSKAEGQMVRVFPVIEEGIEMPPELSTVQVPQSLRLSIGGWDICIQRNDE